MNIANWSLNRIMQLPDFCFGRRWPISIFGSERGINIAYDIAECALPEKTVIWELHVRGSGTEGIFYYAGLRLGDKLPTTAAEFNALELLFPCLDDYRIGRSGVKLQKGLELHLTQLRYPVLSAGRRFVGSFETTFESYQEVHVAFIVSSVPTEVPDWLISGPGRYRW